jgi:hypothetical protein
MLVAKDFSAGYLGLGLNGVIKPSSVITCLSSSLVILASVFGCILGILDGLLPLL